MSSQIAHAGIIVRNTLREANIPLTTQQLYGRIHKSTLESRPGSSMAAGTRAKGTNSKTKTSKSDSKYDHESFQRSGNLPERVRVMGPPSGDEDSSVHVYKFLTKQDIQNGVKYTPFSKAGLPQPPFPEHAVRSMR